MNKKTVLRYIFLALLMTMIIVFLTTNIKSYFKLDILPELLEQFGLWAPFIFIGIYVLLTIFFMPGTILTVLGGFLFGPLWGTLYNLCGAALGSACAFFIARYIASDWVAQKAGGRLKQIISGVEKESWKFVALLRLTPIFPFVLVNYALGLTRINPLIFIISSTIFMIPATFAYTYAGSLGQDFLQQGGRELVTKIVFAAGMLVLLTALPWLVKKVRLR